MGRSTHFITSPGDKPARNGGQRCVARSRTNGHEQCKNWAMKGGTVCKFHGGKIPQVLAAAAERRLVINQFGLAFARDKDAVMGALGCIAASNVADMYDSEGNLLPVADMPDHLKAAISVVEAVTGNVDAGDGKRDKLTRVRLIDKIEALKILAKHHAIDKENVEHGGEIVFRWAGSGK